MKKLSFSLALLLTLVSALSISYLQAQNVFIVDQSTNYVLPSHFSSIPQGGDTILILANRTETLKFKGFEGDANQPIVFINEGGQVLINTTAWGALTFEDCKYIKLSGKGDPSSHYGFKLIGGTSGLSFLEYSSNVEVEFVEIEGIETTFFGIYAKKDFSGNPPSPYPVFKNLSIHDTYIHDLAEGMYIGETISPGMEFRHLRVYNNIVINTLRESVQIANSVDDVEIYNNFFLNAGLENLATQNNGLQIGTNTIANVYNNVIFNSTGYGIILLGNGDMHLNNNLVQHTAGLFIDDRYEVYPYAPIQIENNFLGNVSQNQIIDNRNEFNDLIIKDNTYNPNILFFKNATASAGEIVLENNIYSELETFIYRIEEGVFENSQQNPIIYQNLGPIAGLSHTFNETPVLQEISPIFLTYDQNQTIVIQATSTDSDLITLTTRDLPNFIQFNQVSNSEAELIVQPTIENIGVYEFGILATDASHNATDRQVVQLSVMNPENQTPILTFDKDLVIEAASKFRLDITATDADHDSIYYTTTPLPAFAKLIKIADLTYLELQPKISDTGFYSIAISADDGFGASTTQTLNLGIKQPVLEEGRILYRVNFGGPEIEAEPLNWQADIASVPVYGTTYFLRTGSWFWNGTNSTSAPNNLFGPFRYDVAGGTEMKYAFPISAAGRYHVKLFFAERSTEVDNNTTAIFDVLIENQIVLDHFSIYSNASLQALEQTFDISVEDNYLNLDFIQIENNTKINGIEISYLGDLAENEAPQIQNVGPFSLFENTTLEIPVSIIDDAFETCNTISLASVNAPSFISITQNESGDFSILLKPDFDDAGIYDQISLLVSDGCLSANIPLLIEVFNNNRIPSFETIDDVEMQAGSSLQLAIFASDADADQLTLQIDNAPDFVRLTDFGNGSGTINFEPGLNDLGNFSLEVKVTDSWGGTTSEFLTVHINPAPVIERILLNYDMITDLVNGGSHFTPLYLVNEQKLNPYANDRPKSKSWVPKKFPSTETYSTLIDLGEEYYIDKMLLHDMQFTSDIEISFGSPDLWKHLAIYSTSSFKQWKEVLFGINTRYILLSMTNTVDALINEIALYGYATNFGVKSTQANDNELYKFNYTIYPNPAKDQIAIEHWSEKQHVEILNSTGKVILQSNDKQIDISSLPNGIYLLRLWNDQELLFQDRFIKTQ